MSEEQNEQPLLMRRKYRISLDVVIEVKDNTAADLQHAAGVRDAQERLYLRHYIQDQKELLDALLANPELRDLFLKTLALREIEALPDIRLQKELLGEALHDEEMLGAILATLPEVVQSSFQNSDKGWSLAGAEQFHDSFRTEISGLSLSEVTELEVANAQDAEAQGEEAEVFEPGSPTGESAPGETDEIAESKLDELAVAADEP